MRSKQEALIYRLGQLPCLGEESNTNTTTVTSKGSTVDGFDEQMTLLMTHRPEILI